MSERRERDFQMGRLNGLQKTLCYGLIDVIAWHGLAGFLTQLHMRLIAFIDQRGAFSSVTNTHSIPTKATQHNALQQRRSLAYCSSVGIIWEVLVVGENLLIAKKLFPGDIAWMGIL
jgi:hypothetical protein